MSTGKKIVVATVHGEKSIQFRWVIHHFCLGLWCIFYCVIMYVVKMYVQNTDPHTPTHPHTPPHTPHTPWDARARTHTPTHTRTHPHTHQYTSRGYSRWVQLNQPAYYGHQLSIILDLQEMHLDGSAYPNYLTRVHTSLHLSVMLSYFSCHWAVITTIIFISNTKPRKH